LCAAACCLALRLVRGPLRSLLNWFCRASLVRRGLLPGAAAGARSAALAPELVLQGDNAWSQLKNQFVLGFAAVLVAKGFFRSVRVHFLQQGHTHGILDQRFGVLTHSLSHGACSLTLASCARVGVCVGQSACDSIPRAVRVRSEDL